MQDYYNLVELYEEIINELSDELVNKVRKARIEQAEAAELPKRLETEGDIRQLNKLLQLHAKEEANRILTKQRDERKKGIEHNAEDTENLKVQREEIKRTKQKLGESLLNTLEELGTSIAAMLTPPIGLAGSVQPSKQKKGSQKKGQLGYKYLKIRKASME